MGAMSAVEKSKNRPFISQYYMEIRIPKLNTTLIFFCNRIFWHAALSSIKTQMTIENWKQNGSIFIFPNCEAFVRNQAETEKWGQWHAKSYCFSKSQLSLTPEAI